MISFNKKITLAAITALFALNTNVALADSKTNNPVYDNAGHKVRSIAFDTCVRTKWDTKNGVDICAPEKPAIKKAPQAEAKKAEPRKATYEAARRLKKEDKTVYFAFDSHKLSETAKNRLDRLAGSLKNSKDIRTVSIVGFADKIGSSAYNLKLSQLRAQSVQDYLADRGYIKTRLAKTRGLGSTNSVTNCSDKSRTKLISCLGADRRVEVEIEFIEEGLRKVYR